MMQLRLFTGTLAAAIVLSCAPAWAEQKPTLTNPVQPTGGPLSTPTWTIGTQASPDNLVIKQKSSSIKEVPANSAREADNNGANVPVIRGSALGAREGQGGDTKPKPN